MSPPRAHEKLDALTDLQFLFVTGKGGVGKSTTAALLGLHAARRGKSALVVVPQTSHIPPSRFNQNLSEEPRTIAGSGGLLSAVSVQPEGAMRQYCQKVLHSQTLTNALFHPRVAGGFLLGIPGLSEWALLGKSWAWTRSGTFDLPVGDRRYDVVIFDAPASGDGTKMLRMPQVITDLSPSGRLRDDAAACRELLADRKRSAVLVVSLAEDFSVTETQENVTFIEHELGLPVGSLLVNRLVESHLSALDLGKVERTFARLDESRAPSELPLWRALRAAAHHEHRCRTQEAQLARLADWRTDIIEIPEMNQDLSDVSGLGTLLDRVVGATGPTGDQLG